MDTPISVLMTVYNGGHFLKKSIGSVFNQNFSNFEFLIVDDCSSDGSVALIKSYSDPRIVLCENKVNQGQTKSLNIGLNKAKGKYIARMDADDIALPQWLKKVYNFITKNSVYSVVSPQALIIDENSKVKQYTGLPLSYHEVILKNIMESPINHVGSLMRREDIVKVGGYDEKYVIAADYDLWTKLLIGGYRLVNMDEILTAIRIHNVSTGMRGKSIRDAECIDIMQKNTINFTNCFLTKNETRILWKILNDIKVCDEETRNADELIDKLYDNIKPELGLSNSLIQKVKEEKKQGVFKKRIYLLLQKNKYDSAKDALREYIQAKGSFNFFGLLYFLSFSPIFTKNIEIIYYNLLSLLTKMRFSRIIKTLKS
ncbi:MAG: glycosyltransferase [Candidatus Omnitrophota bacterium]